MNFIPKTRLRALAPPMRHSLLSRPTTAALAGRAPALHNLSASQTPLATPKRNFSSVPCALQSRCRSQGAKRRDSPPSPVTATQSRSASTTASPDSTTRSSGGSQKSILPWNDFFRLRQRRRYFDLASSIIVGSGSLVSGVGFLTQQNPDTLGFAGIDPLVGMALLSIGFAVCGWLSGPVIGSGLFRLFNRGASEMSAKERDFYTRIKKFRIDPSSSSVQNPVPDYYGEKITSVAGYRQWLKDQRAFNKKRQSFL